MSAFAKQPGNPNDERPSAQTLIGRRGFLYGAAGVGALAVVGVGATLASSFPGGDDSGIEHLDAPENALTSLAEFEVIDDALCALSGSKRNYQSPAPEPFTFLPPKRKTVSIEDGSISNGFLTLFGRPARDSGLDNERGEDVTAKQRLYLFNSGKLNRQIGSMILPGGQKVDGRPNPLLALNFRQRIEELYWRIVSRAPTESEAWTLQAEQKRRKGRNWDLYRDLIWCLVNTKEFLFRI